MNKKLHAATLIHKYMDELNSPDNSNNLNNVEGPKKRITFLASKAPNKNLFCVSCEECGINFGLDHSFLDKVSEMSFVFTCPYCSTKGKI